MVRLAIFDLDGTLLNTLEDLARAGNYALALRGFPTHPTEAFRYFVGDGVIKLVERMTPEAMRGDKTLLAELKMDFDAYYGAHGEDATKPYDDALALLDELNARGVLCVVLSNKPHEFACTLCPRYFGERLTLVHGQRVGFPCKPDGGLVREILEKTGVSARDCIYIGDSGVDMRTAKNGCVFAVGALWGFRTETELTENGADALAAHPLEVLNYIEINC